MLIVVIMQCFRTLVDCALNIAHMPQRFMFHTKVLRHTAFSDGAKTNDREGWRLAREWQCYISIYLSTRLLYVAVFTSHRV